MQSKTVILPMKGQSAYCSEAVIMHITNCSSWLPEDPDQAESAERSPTDNANGDENGAQPGGEDEEEDEEEDDEIYEPEQACLWQSCI